ncbi:MAG: hypothetical protein Q9171_004681 [Xanthocarpia ochracea]
MPPQPLQIGSAWENGSPKFVQQGQVDWVAFGNTVWSASAAVLQRFASSGIQPMTFGAGLALASQFRMSDGGRQRMDQAMQSLRGVPGFGKTLWFGFGYQSFVKVMGESQLGLNTVALCSCLAEVHSEELAARVLAELWKLNRFPEEHEPSYSQFLALVKACSGVVTSSAFNSNLDSMTGYGRWRMYDDVHPWWGLKASNASDIASALHGLFQITRGKVEKITLLGQNECAFIAALASWLFDLKIFIEDDAGNVFFTSRETPHKAEAQVVVVYTTEDQPTALQQSTIYILPVGTDLVSSHTDSSASRWIHRIPWDGCLLRTFGSTFRDLSGLAHTFGSFLGGAARIYAALARGEPNVANFCRTRFIGFSQFSYGQGFVHSVTTTFKELERVASLKGAMERALDSTFDSAYREVEQAAQSLRNSCHCDLCSSRPPHGADFADAEFIGADCLFALAMAIRNMVADLSCTVRDDALLVAVYGLQLYYTRNHNNYSEWVEYNEHERTLVGVAVGLASVTDPHDIDFPKHKTALQEVRSLFDGSMGDEAKASRYIVAEASSGICCYRESLHGISSEAGAMRTIHVVPGHIERGTAQYDCVGDLKAGIRPAIPESVTLTKAETAIPKHEPIRLGKFEIKSLATESSEYGRLEFGYKVFLPNGSISQIQPGRFSEQVVTRTGNVGCYRSKKCKQNLAFPCSAVLKGWTIDDSTRRLLHYNSGLALCIWSYSEDIARCVAFDIYSVMSFGADAVFLRRDECLPCCTESALRETAAPSEDASRELTHIF